MVQEQYLSHYCPPAQLPPMAVFASLANGLGQWASTSGGTTVGLKRGQLLRVAKANLSWVSVSSLVVFFCFLMIGSPGFASASASSIYISQNSAGAANGADCVNAYAYTFFNNSANWGSGAGQIGPGTTVHICGTFNLGAGATFLTAQGSGTSGNPITIHFEPNALVRAPYFPTSGAIAIDNLSFITVDGGTNGTIQATLNGSAGGICPGGPCTNQQTSSAAIHARPCTNCEIKNLIIADIYDHTLFSDNNGNTSIFGITINGSNLLIHNNVMHDIGIAIDDGHYGADSNVQFYNNNMYNDGWGIGCAGSAVTVTDMYIYNNHFHDGGNWNSSGDATHGNGIHCFNGSGGGIAKLYLYNNLFDGSMGACCTTAWVYLEGGAQHWTTATGQLLAWNNIFILDKDIGNGLLAINAGTGHIVYNNTFIVTATGSGQCLHSRGGQSGASITVENNAFSGCNQMVSFDSAIATATFNNNVYANSVGGGNNIFQWDTHSTTNSFATWQSQCACDAASQANLAGSLGTTAAGVPLAGSMLIGLGANLTSQATGNLASLSSDTGAGNTHTPLPRLSSGSWDVGAYLSLSAANLPQPPTGLTAVVQ
jgi:hypothetical protein